MSNKLSNKMRSTSLRSLSGFTAAGLCVAAMCGASAAGQAKKAAPAAPAKAAPAPVKAPAAASAPHAAAGGASAAAHGPSTATAHGPTTSTAAGATTHGPTTATAGAHGPTTSSPTTTTAGTHGPTTSSPAAAGAHGTTTTTAGAAGGRGGAATAGGPGRAGSAPETARGGFGGNTGRGGPGGAVHGSPEAMRASGPMAGHAAPMGAHEMHAANGGMVRSRADGRPMDVHDARHGMDVHHDLGGSRRVMMDRPGGGRGFYERGRPGYLGHPYRAHGYDFNRRTYYYHGRAYDRYYRPYGFHGYALDVYVPGRYYAPGFYGWAYNPWAVPVAYGWGFAAAPWYGFYGGYFTPYPVYAGPAFWVTDYLISQSLAEAYAAHQEAGLAAAPFAGQPLSPQVKDMVAQEVKNDINLENSEAQANTQQQAPDPASSGIGRLFGDGQSHVFVADKEVDVVAADGNECAVSDGDVVQLQTPPADADTTANVTVLSSKGGKDCMVSAQVAIGIDDLSEMNNALRARIDTGLEELQKKQGTGGLPKAPPSAMAPASTALVADGAPPPDPAGAKELDAMATQSTKDEGDLVKETQGGGPSATPDATPASAPPPAAVPTQTVSIEKGQTLAQVQSAMGTPTKIVNLGSKSYYYFGDIKVTIVAGKVTSVD